MNSDATRQVPHAQRLLHRETTTVVAAKPNGALAALAEATLAAAKGDVAQGEAAVPARGRRQRRDRSDEARSNCRWKSGEGRRKCQARLPRDEQVAPAVLAEGPWPRDGRRIRDGNESRRSSVRHREGGGLRSRFLESASVLDLLGPAVTAPIAPIIRIGKSIHGLSACLRRGSLPFRHVVACQEPSVGSEGASGGDTPATFEHLRPPPDINRAPPDIEVKCQRHL